VNAAAQDRLNDPALRSWVPVVGDSDFPIQNLPFGVAKRDGVAAVGAAIGDHLLDLGVVARAGLFDGHIAGATACFGSASLNALLARGRQAWTASRARVSDLLSIDNRELLDAGIADRALVRQAAVEMLRPIDPGDYVDFYSSLEHATNVGRILRPAGEPLTANWRYMPIGYHGRAANIFASAAPVVRPRGQIKMPAETTPAFGPTQSLDFEAELGFITGNVEPAGAPLTPAQARDVVFGAVVLNDWSARDIQAWEYQPLGPFLGKSFATSISPWVVTLDALEPYRMPPPKQDPAPLPYLHAAQDWNYDIALEVALRTKKMRGENISAEIISRSNFKYLYWSMAQQLAHATSNGATISPGDLFASGTISGPEPASYGSLIELTWRGTKPLKLASGEERRFLEDGDEVRLTGYCEAPGKPRIGFGSVSGLVASART